MIELRTCCATHAWTNTRIYYFAVMLPSCVLYSSGVYVTTMTTKHKTPTTPRRFFLCTNSVQSKLASLVLVSANSSSDAVILTPSMHFTSHLSYLSIPSPKSPTIRTNNHHVDDNFTVLFNFNLYIYVWPHDNCGASRQPEFDCDCFYFRTKAYNIFAILFNKSLHMDVE